MLNSFILNMAHKSITVVALKLKVNSRSRAIMDIYTGAKRSGDPASTLRYYEEKGLIRSVGRNGLRRVLMPI